MRKILNNDTKKEIIQCYNENMPFNEIIKKFGISRATYYRLVKSYTSDKLSSDKSLNETINETLNEPENDNNEDEKEEEEVYEEEKDFNKDDFKKALNTETEPEEEQVIETIPIIENKPVIETKQNDLSFISRNSRTSRLSRVSFKPKRNLSVVNKSNILDTIKNVQDAGSIDELKEKRNLIIIIRQYINTFPEELKDIYLLKSTFEKKLFIQTIEQLKVILENIRITLSLTRNKEIFFTCVETGLRGFETISNYSGYDITGVTNDLMNDPDFLMDLKIISCEVDVSKYINPKSSAFLKVLKKVYTKHQENEIKSKINNVINDPDKIQKILNLDKNKKII